MTNTLFPRDLTHGPIPGTPDYDEFIDDQLTIINADYVRSTSKLSPVADEIFDEVSANAVRLISAVMPGKPLRLLDICCGVGLAVEAIMNLGIPVESLTLTEQDPRLLERAQAYLREKGLLDRIGTVKTAVFDPNIHRLSDRVEGELDLVVSCNAFQHFSCEHQKDLIQQIHDQLGPSGMLVMQSHIKVHSPDWRNQIIEHMKAQMAAMNAPPDFVERAIRHTTKFHNFVPATDLFEWCRSAGFTTVDCLFRRHIIGVVGAIK